MLTRPGCWPVGEIPVIMPEKLSTNKYVVELEPAGDGADDLTGDTGAVGRMLVSGAASQLLQAHPRDAHAHHAYAQGLTCRAYITRLPSHLGNTISKHA